MHLQDIGCNAIGVPFIGPSEGSTCEMRVAWDGLEAAVTEQPANDWQAPHRAQVFVTDMLHVHPAYVLLGPSLVGGITSTARMTATPTCHPEHRRTRSTGPAAWHSCTPLQP